MRQLKVLTRATLFLAFGAMIGCGAGSSGSETSKPMRSTTRHASPGDAPSATVFASDGSAVELASLWATSNVALVFYRGHW